MKFGTATHIGPLQGTSVTIFNSWKFKMAAVPSWKVTKIAISWKRFDGSLRSFVHWCQMGPLKGPTVKKIEFHKSKMADGRHYENRKIAISLQPFDWFWWNLAWWRILAPYSGSTVKFRIFENSRWRQPPFWKSQKSRYLPTVWPIFSKFGMLMQNGSLTRPDR